MPATPAQSNEPPAHSSALTIRAVVTGMCLGALLVPCNIYSGLKIGWSFNMSIPAVLLAYAFWQTLHRTANTRAWGLQENIVNQTSASAGASIISAGLVAPIPALTLLTGRQLAWSTLAWWTFVVSFTGVVVAIGLRYRMIVTGRLPFPAGVATAETLREMYGHGKEALRRLQVLLVSGTGAAALQLFQAFGKPIPKSGLPVSWGWPVPAGVLPETVRTFSLKKLGFVLDPSLLMIGFGAIVGVRIGLSLLLGALLSWGLIGPWVLAQGWVPADTLADAEFWFGPLVEWLLWPGVALMVTASLSDFVFLAFKTLRREADDQKKTAQTKNDGKIPSTWFWSGAAIALVLCVATQVALFDIPLALAVFAVLLTGVLAVVAARVSGETGIPPIGALGKVTQVTFGVISPANTTTNLMAANVTGGAAGQCSDLLHDFKAGHLLEAPPANQAIAQVFGILSGSLAGCAAYLVLIPDPAAMLLTPEWPAPAVAVWKAVAEVFQQGIEALPPAVGPAMAVAAMAGLLLSLLTHLSKPSVARYLPSAASVGLAFVIPAWISISLFLGGLAAWLLERRVPEWHRRFLIVVAAGLVAGESLAGVIRALLEMGIH